MVIFGFLYSCSSSLLFYLLHRPSIFKRPPTHSLCFFSHLAKRPTSDFFSTHLSCAYVTVDLIIVVNSDFCITLVLSMLQICLLFLFLSRGFPVLLTTYITLLITFTKNDLNILTVTAYYDFLALMFINWKTKLAVIEAKEQDFVPLVAKITFSLQNRIVS